MMKSILILMLFVANIGEYSDISITDIGLAVNYKLALGFGISAGIWQQILDLDGFNGVDLHSNAIGVFVDINFHF